MKTFLLFIGMVGLIVGGGFIGDERTVGGIAIALVGGIVTSTASNMRR